MFFSNLTTQLRKNVREYGMYIVLFVIMAIFTITTEGTFISSRNIANLMNQVGYIVVLAVGMTLVIVIRHIDLSVGFLSGFIGALCALAMKYWGLPVYIIIPMSLGIGAVAGLIVGYLVAEVQIPAFVATLAGWMIYRGAILLALIKDGTVITSDEAFNAIGNGYIPDLPDMGFLPEVHKLTLLLGLLAIIAFIIGQVHDRKTKKAYRFEVLPMDMFILKLIVMSILLGLITWVLAGYNGLSWTLVIVLIVVFIFDFIATRTVLGRHIYAVGGNPEAATLSGIDVKKVTYFVFGSMGALAGLCGILFASRLRSATPTAGNMFEMDAIAAAYVGGVSAAGGVGKITGSFIGALVMISLTSGMNLMGLDISFQYIVRGAILVIAVIFDVFTRNRAL